MKKKFENKKKSSKSQEERSNRDASHNIKKMHMKKNFGHPVTGTVLAAPMSECFTDSISGSAPSLLSCRSPVYVPSTDSKNHPGRTNNYAHATQLSNSDETHAAHVPSSVETHAFQAVDSITSSQHQSDAGHSKELHGLHTNIETTEINRELEQQNYHSKAELSKKICETMSIGSFPGKRKSAEGVLANGAKTIDSKDNNSECSAKRNPRKSTQMKPGQSAGRWTPEEHQEFLEGLKVYGREWKKVAERIPTRTSAQIRSHAQKYFAKLAREENMMLQDQLASMGTPRNSSVLSTVSEPNSDRSFSIQRNVERILANPSNVQNEVEDTLRELRERYRQLQVRLEESTHSQEPTESDRTPRFVIESYETNEYDSYRSQAAVEQRKRGLDDSPVGSQLRYFHHDDLSSVSSSVSGISRGRELGNEELIALSVLGGSLPRSSSSHDLPQVSNISNIERSSSPTSTIASNQDTDDNSERAKKRKGTDGRMIN